MHASTIVSSKQDLIQTKKQSITLIFSYCIALNKVKVNKISMHESIQWVLALHESNNLHRYKGVKDNN